jgi:hypothetical protein
MCIEAKLSPARGKADRTWGCSLQVPLAVKQALLYKHKHKHKQQSPFFVRCETAFIASVTIQGTQTFKEEITVNLRKWRLFMCRHPHALRIMQLWRTGRHGAKSEFSLHIYGQIHDIWYDIFNVYCTLTEVLINLTGVFLTLTEGFSVLFPQL